MMQQHTNHQQHISDDSDRQNRFIGSHPGTDAPASLRERSSSQPPRTTNADFLPTQQGPKTPLGGTSGSWLNAPSSQRFPSGLAPNSAQGLNVGMPIRSASFSSAGQNPQAFFASAMRETRTFPSTFEDDEEALSDMQDTFDDYLPSRGRPSYGPDITRSRSQSLATATRPGAVGGGWLGPNWQQSESYSNPLNIPSNHYNEMRVGANSRHGSFTGTRNFRDIYNSSPSGNSPIASSYSQRQISADISNVSPFVRDVGQILLDDGSAFRELWAGMHPPRDENGAGGSGTTSRRHSVSVVQPRRPTVVGFNAPGDLGEETNRSSLYQTYPSSGLMLTDDDLASDLGGLSLNGGDHTNGSAQPSSLPAHALLSRNPQSADRMSPYQNLNLNIPGGSYANRQAIGSPSEGSILSGSPRSFTSGNQGRMQAAFQQRKNDNILAPSLNRALSSAASIPSQQPMSPTTRGPFQNATPAQRGPPDAGATSSGDLGKGVPLHAVPSHWQLFIVEFKAGRTDLFYNTDSGQDIRLGDLVIVEADRGKDLGKVVNDTITLGEVDAFQKQQAAKTGGYVDDPNTSMNPNGPGASGKKDINPKRIFGKAQNHDIQALQSKIADEERALELCRTKARQKKLPMEVIDAEFQWDRRKLTFYFIAEKRIDFRELVRELFRVFKTRIWLSALSSSAGYEQ